MAIDSSRWDTADHLDSREATLAYLEVVFEEGDPELIARALNNVTRAKGLAHEDLTAQKRYQLGDRNPEGPRARVERQGGVNRSGCR